MDVAVFENVTLEMDTEFVYSYDNVCSIYKLFTSLTPSITLHISHRSNQPTIVVLSKQNYKHFLSIPTLIQPKDK